MTQKNITASWKNPSILKEYVDQRTKKKMHFISYSKGRTRHFANIKADGKFNGQLFNNPDREVFHNVSVPFLATFLTQTTNLETGENMERIWKKEGRITGNVKDAIQTAGDELQQMFSLSKHLVSNVTVRSLYISNIRRDVTNMSDILLFGATLKYMSLDLDQNMNEDGKQNCVPSALLRLYNDEKQPDKKRIKKLT